MRIFEIADAEAQLALWKLLNDSVWTAIQTQQHEQAKQKAAAQQQKKNKRSTKRISKRSISVPLPPPKVPMPTAKPKQLPIQKAATPTQQNANPHHNQSIEQQHNISENQIPRNMIICDNKVFDELLDSAILNASGDHNL